MKKQATHAKRVMIRLTEQEYMDIERLANEEGVTVAIWLRVAAKKRLSEPTWTERLERVLEHFEGRFADKEA